jgi:hypothetical protein
MYVFYICRRVDKEFARGAKAKSQKIVHKRLIGKTDQRRLKEGVEK